MKRRFLWPQAAMVTLLLLLTTVNATFALGNDDLFGMSYDTASGTRTSFIPSGAVGLQAGFSESTTGVTLASGMTGACTGTSGAGWVYILVTVKTGGTGGGYYLQGGAELVRLSNGSYVWEIGYGYFDTSSNWFCGTVGNFSASTYSTITGLGKIYYDSSASAWYLSVTISQNSQTYTYTYPSGIGTSIDSNDNDWTSLETPAQQSGVTFSSTFNWQITSPKFLVSGTWQNWNVQGSNYKELGVYEVFQPLKSGNTVGVWPLTTPGMKVYIGNNYSYDGADIYWCIQGTCPLYKR